ncbi:MAG: HAMP domain-containing sensor histidine kinase [Patescibacteria group bacterium]
MLLNNLLDLHHSEEGKMHYEFQKLELNKLLKDIAEGFQIVARQRNLDLIFEPSLSEVYVSGDIYKLSQVFQNLIDNAMKYTEKGWIKISVKDEEAALVVISDSGRGMSQDLAKRLFQKFSRGVEDTKAYGSGLGLYISKEIVGAHQGKIWVESEGEGKGSKFFVRLSKIS